jgi:hypothetical protein
MDAEYDFLIVGIYITLVVALLFWMFVSFGNVF